MTIEWEVRNTREEGNGGSSLSLPYAWGHALSFVNDFVAEERTREPITIEVHDQEALVVPCEMFSHDEDNIIATQVLVCSLRAEITDAHRNY